jgi:8-oxo-dGTP pyrophosphatase MutT (NUDIX family)
MMTQRVNSSDIGDTNNVAGIVLVRFFEEGPKILGLRLYGRYDLPKGHMKIHEDPRNSAIRETFEETGFSEQDLQFFSSRYTGKSHEKNKILNFFIAEVDHDPQISWEHHGFVWLSRDDSRNQKFYDYLKPIVWWAWNAIEREIK